MANSKRHLFLKRRMRVRNKLRKVNAGRVRLSVHRSNKNISCQLIDDVQFSLLDCPGRFTVRVAKFTGNVSYNIQKGFNAEQKLSNKLVVAAENAHKLTMALRSQNIEAYEFHDRTSSIVTVGAFKNVGTRQFNGNLQLDPRIQGIINAYKAQRQFAPGATQVSVKPKRLAGIPFDVTPEPIPVPGKSVSSSFARSR